MGRDQQVWIGVNKKKKENNIEGEEEDAFLKNWNGKGIHCFPLLWDSHERQDQDQVQGLS